MNFSYTKIESLDVSKNTALTSLNCSGTGITDLDVSQNQALTTLDCSGTGITTLDVSKNTALTSLGYSDNPQLTSLDVSKNIKLERLRCTGTGITNLYVSKNTALKSLDFSDTRITSLDLSKNIALTSLGCSDNPQLTSLDVSKNTALSSLNISSNPNLETLNCSGTQISELNLSGNTALKYLYCSNNPKLTSLDVSKNIALEYLDCTNTRIINLNIGNNNLSLDYDENKTKDLTLTSDSFNVKNKLECDVSKIGNITWANLDKNTGIMTIESIDTPITYEYDCGTSKNGPVVLNVTLNLKRGDREIKINDDLNKTYDGNFITLIKNNCTIKEATTYDDVSTVNDGDVTFTYYKKNLDGEWEEVQEAKEAGEYKVVANLEKAEYWNEAVGEKEFKISQATNEWKDELLIDGWTYGETPKEPTASAQFGDVEFSYSNSEDGEFSTTVPTTAGTWYVKAEVVGNDNYTGIDDKKKFTITKAKPTYFAPTNLKATYGQTLEDIKLQDGFEWVNATQSVGNVGENKFMITYTPKDTDNYEIVNDTVTVNVTKAENTWTKALSIEGWTYGETPKKPTASAQFGEVKFSYSNENGRAYTEEVPTEAGTWYVKAEVVGNNNYTGIDDKKEFTIAKAVAPKVALPDNLSAVQDNLLSKVELPEGWAWVNPNEKVTVNKSGYKARLKVDDNNYDYSKVEGYNKDGHYVERTLKVSVSQGENAWKVVPSIKGWTYGEKANTPVASAEHGKVIFTYSNSKDGKFESTVPKNAGTWYMKATVLATDEYTGLNEIVEFKIEKATPKFEIPKNLTASFGQTLKDIKLPEGFTWVDATQSVGNVGQNKFIATYTPKDTNNYKVVENIEITVTVSKLATPEVIEPSNLSAVQNDLLSTVELPEGWTWVNPNEKVTVNNNGYKARLKVDDEKYDYTNVEGYNKDGHYVERALKVSVSENRNEWNIIPSIKGWTYGEGANTPIGAVKHGEVIFTYSNSPTGKFESTVPKNAGIWYMKATVLATDEYTGFNEIIEFEIKKATPKFEIPKDIKEFYGQTLEDIKLPEGFTWKDDKQPVGNVGTNKFIVIYTPEDINNYEIVEDIEVYVMVEKAKNNWTEDISIEDWTYGDKASNPSASGKFGEVIYVYSNKKGGEYTADVPTEAGKWYVKAVVEETENYYGLESKALVFNITPKDGTQLSISEIKSDKDLDNLIIKDGSKILDSSKDYKVTKKQEGNTITVTITFKGNYTGTIIKTYEVEVKPSLPQTGEKSNLGLWGLLLTITGGAIAFITGKGNKRIRKEK